MGQVLAAIPVMGQILIAMGQRIVIPKVEVRLYYGHPTRPLAHVMQYRLYEQLTFSLMKSY